jgi:hypothetical protein
LKSPEQQTAASREPEFVSSSEIEPPFKDMLADAVRICRASYGAIFHLDLFNVPCCSLDGKGGWQATAMLGAPTEFVQFWLRAPRRPDPPTVLSRVVETVLGRALETRQTIHIDDVATEPVYIEGESGYVPVADCRSFRTFFNVPIFNDSELISVLALYRQEVRPFTDRQIKLAENCARQAVIAMREIFKAQEQELLSAQKWIVGREKVIGLIRDRYGISEWRARKLLKDIRNEVERKNWGENDDPDCDWAWKKDGFWECLDLKFGGPKTSESEPQVPRHRYPDDIPRIEEARKLHARGVSKSAAAKEVVSRETGLPPEQCKTDIDRLRKKL